MASNHRPLDGKVAATVQVSRPAPTMAAPPAGSNPSARGMNAPAIPPSHGSETAGSGARGHGTGVGSAKIGK